MNYCSSELPLAFAVILEMLCNGASRLIWHGLQPAYRLAIHSGLSRNDNYLLVESIVTLSSSRLSPAARNDDWPPLGTAIVNP